MGSLSPSTFSKKPTKTVVKEEPIKVFNPIPLPRTQKAMIINEKLITIKMFDGEKDKKKFKITEMPLVPPSSKECGKINNTVLIA